MTAEVLAPVKGYKGNTGRDHTRAAIHEGASKILQHKKTMPINRKADHVNHFKISA